MADEQLEYEEVEEQSERVAAPEGGSDLPLKHGAITGVAAFLAGYVTTFAVLSSEITASGVDTSDQPATWIAAAWGFLGSQGVGMEVDGDAIGVLDGVSGVGVGSSVLTTVLPVLLLVGAGYAVAKYAGDGGLEESAKASLTIVPGYLALSLVLAFASGWESPNEVELALVTGDAILHAGIIYPAVFGLIGGLLACWPEPVDRILAKIE